MLLKTRKKAVRKNNAATLAAVKAAFAPGAKRYTYSTWEAAFPGETVPAMRTTHERAIALQHNADGTETVLGEFVWDNGLASGPGWGWHNT